LRSFDNPGKSQRVYRPVSEFFDGFAPSSLLLRARDTIMVVRLVEAQYKNGVLRPSERMGLRPGERVNIIVVRRPDPGRWDLARLGKTGNGDDLARAEQGLAEWASELEAKDRS